MNFRLRPTNQHDAKLTEVFWFFFSKKNIFLAYDHASVHRKNTIEFQVNSIY
jgi:hypothetical protein